MKIVIDEDEVETRLEEIGRQVADLNKEREGLTLMLRLARQFHRPVAADKNTAGEESEGNRLGPARPDGIPTLYQMTYEVIREAEQQGLPGLPGAVIVEMIGSRYWPGVKAPQVMPSVHGFAKMGRLTKTDDGLFHTVQKNEAPPGEPDGAS